MSMNRGIAGLMPGRNSLGRRVMRAGGWNMLQFGTTQAFRLISNLIMTRILVPEAFGLMALVGTVLAAFSLFSDIGVGRSVIRETDGDDPHFLRVAWVVKIVRGTFVAGCVLIAALAIWVFAGDLAPPSTAYADPRLPGLLAISALSPVMLGAISPNRQVAIRRLLNWRNASMEIAAHLFSILCMIGFAQISPTVWALLAGMLMNNLFILIASHLIFPGPRMRFEWDREIADRLWQFGKFLMWSNIFSFLASNADRFILAGLLGSATFGLYVIAKIWVGAGKSLVTRLSNQVGFPAMSEVIRERPQDVPRLFRRFQTVIDLFCLSGFLTTVLLGNWLIGLLYTDTYADAGTYLQLMSLAFLVIRFNPLNTLVMNMGNTRALMWIAAARAAAIVVTLPLGFWLLGLKGAIIAATLNPLVTAPYTLALTRPLLGVRQTLYDGFWLGATLVVAAAIYLVI